MRRFRKKPIIITAEEMANEFWVDTLEGRMRGKPGDYLVTGIKGEQYPCDREIFGSSYEEVFSE